eukprot:s2749_g6.t1
MDAGVGNLRPHVGTDAAIAYQPGATAKTWLAEAGRGGFGIDRGGAPKVGARVVEDDATATRRNCSIAELSFKVWSLARHGSARPEPEVCLAAWIRRCRDASLNLGSTVAFGVLL